MKLDFPIMTDWYFMNKIDSPFLAPELRKRYLVGKVLNHSSYPDNISIRTSAVRRLFEEQGVIIVETRNSRYIIREKDVNQEYLRHYPTLWWDLTQGGYDA